MSKQELTVFSEQEKIKAAYALNMCMVSVSQIIDYNDLYVLEQEYDAILNNLNLEEMPKDEAFLDVLKQILDTITFFRIQEGDKRMVEKEYQHKMKNAIWSGISNIPVFAMGGNPVTTAVSIATAVGSAYMNYRRAKADATLEKEKKEWELQRSAMEQFNGLRRELFNTAWHISAQYQFSDEYRLTEKQITQYNSILMDNNYLRRYDRLDTIKGSFKAYPAFWYFFGNTAAVLSNDTSLSDELRNSYKQKAISHFEYFSQNNKYNILREDQISSSCALEYIDLLDCKKDAEKINSLLSSAVKVSGNANDILQLCAVQYLKIENYAEASKLLKILVNEGYNRDVNAQLLSTLIVAEYIKTDKKNLLMDYEVLTKRSGNTLLMPMPNNESSTLKELENEFIDKQRHLILKLFASVYSNLVTKYTVDYNRIFDAFEGKYDDTYYNDLDSDKRSIIICETQALFTNRAKWRRYIEKLTEKSISFEVLNTINKFISALFKLPIIDEQSKKAILKQVYIDFKSNFQNLFSETEKCVLNGQFSIEDYMKIISVHFENYFFSNEDTKGGIVNSATKTVTAFFSKYVYSLNSMYALNELTDQLDAFRRANKLPEVTFDDKIEPTDMESVQQIPYEILEGSAFGEGMKHKALKDMRQYVEDMQEEILIDPENSAHFILNGTTEFSRYRLENKAHKYLEKDTFAIFDVEGKKDLAFTVSGIRKLSNDECVHYKDIKFLDGEIKLNKNSYDTGNIDLSAFEELCQSLAVFEEELEKAGYRLKKGGAAGQAAATLGAYALFGIPGAIVANRMVEKKRKREAHAVFDSKKISPIEENSAVQDFEAWLGINATTAPTLLNSKSDDAEIDDKQDVPSDSLTSKQNTLSKSDVKIINEIKNLPSSGNTNYYFSEIPFKKLLNAKKSFSLNDIDDLYHNVIAIIDTSILSSCKEGLLFTKTKLYIKEAFLDVVCFDYASIKSVQYVKTEVPTKKGTTTKREIVITSLDGKEKRYAPIGSAKYVKGLYGFLKRLPKLYAYSQEKTSETDI